MIFPYVLIVNNLKEKKLPAEMNRNRFDLFHHGESKMPTVNETIL